MEKKLKDVWKSNECETKFMNLWVIKLLHGKCEKMKKGFLPEGEDNITVQRWDQPHYYISIQNPMVFSDGAWIFSFNRAKNQKDNFFFWNGGISVALAMDILLSVA